MTRLMLSVAVCCLMTACAAGPQRMQADPIQVPPPASLTVPPQPLPPPLSGKPLDLEANHREVARLYHQLASQLCSLLQHLEMNDEGCAPWMNDTSPRPRSLNKTAATMHCNTRASPCNSSTRACWRA